MWASMSGKLHHANTLQKLIRITGQYKLMAVLDAMACACCTPQSSE